MVNFFGFAQDLNVYLDFASKKKALIIEDNAHGLFSSDLSGNLLGTRTSIGILSIRKSTNIPNSGALLVNDKRIRLEHNTKRFYRENNKDIIKKRLKNIFAVSPVVASNSFLQMTQLLRK